MQYNINRYIKSPTLSLPIWVLNMLNHFFLIRNVGNPVIYCIVNKKFKKFTLRLLQRHFPCLASLTTQQVTENSSNPPGTDKLASLPLQCTLSINPNTSRSPSAMDNTFIVLSDVENSPVDVIMVTMESPGDEGVLCNNNCNSIQLDKSKLGPGNVYIGWQSFYMYVQLNALFWFVALSLVL